MADIDSDRRALMDQAAFRRWLVMVIEGQEWCHASADPWDSDGAVLLRNVGEQRVGIKLRLWAQGEPGMWMRALTEAANEQRKLALEVERAEMAKEQ